MSVLLRATPLPQAAFAFQPIVDVAAGRPVSWEALLRSSRGDPAAQVLGAVPARLLHSFDESLRPRAIAWACRLGIDCDLNLNFLPRSLLASATALDTTMEAAAREGLAPNRLVLEINEAEVIDDLESFVQRINRYRSLGVKVAIDDFGAGYSGLNLLADFQPDQVKLDMKLVRGIQTNGPRQAIVRGICLTCSDLGIDVVAEGVETLEEYAWLRQEGVTLFQGYLFARPGFLCLPPITLPLPPAVRQAVETA